MVEVEEEGEVDDEDESALLQRSLFLLEALWTTTHTRNVCLRGALRVAYAELTRMPAVKIGQFGGHWLFGHD